MNLMIKSTYLLPVALLMLAGGTDNRFRLRRTDYFPYISSGGHESRGDSDRRGYR